MRRLSGWLKEEQVEIRMTTLGENSASPVPRGLIGEWGLSVLVEVDGLTILLDTGQSASTVTNGDILGIEWPTIDKIVLSHGHYDHSGGLRQVLGRLKRELDIIAHPAVWAAKYAHSPSDNYTAYIGIPFRQEELESLGAVFRLTKQPTWLSDNVVTSGEIPMTTEYETIDAGLYVKENGQLCPDPLEDDQALFIKTNRGLVVILGCAHRGTINTLRHAQEVTGVESIHAVIGGTHLFRASELQLEATIAELRAFGIQRLGVSHCTGMAAAARLSVEFGQDFFFNSSGMRVVV